MPLSTTCTKTRPRTSGISAPALSYTRVSPPMSSFFHVASTRAPSRKTDPRPPRPTVGLDHGPVRPRRHRLYLRPQGERLPALRRRSGADGPGRRKAGRRRNVIVLFQRLSYDPESEPGYRRPVLDQIGSGDAIVFRDGARVDGTWKKDDIGGLTRLYDKAGAEIPLVRGRIFVQVVDKGTKVTSTFR